MISHVVLVASALPYLLFMWSSITYVSAQAADPESVLD